MVRGLPSTYRTERRSEFSEWWRGGSGCWGFGSGFPLPCRVAEVLTAARRGVTSGLSRFYRAGAPWTPCRMMSRPAAMARSRARRSVLVAGSWIFTDLARRGRRRRRPSSARRPVRVAEDDRVVDCQAERRRCGPGSGDRSGKPCRLRRVSILALLCRGTPPADRAAWRLVPGDQLSCAVDSAPGDGAVG